MRARFGRADPGLLGAVGDRRRSLVRIFRECCPRGVGAPGRRSSRRGAAAGRRRQSSSNAPALSVPARAAPPAGARYSCSTGYAAAASESGTVMPFASAPAASV